MSTFSVAHPTLGKNGPPVPPLGLGLMGLSGGYGTPPPDEERFKFLDRALELGATFWDTSNLYGDNEVMLGKWFKQTGNRDQVFLASKFGISMESRNVATFKIDSSPENCKNCCNASLERLGVDCIDLYYAHRVNPETPIESTIRAMAELKAEGKIKNIGLCGVSSTTLRRACKIAPVAAVQVEYSPFALDIEQEKGTHLLQTCRELGVAIVCYSPLGRGLLTGAFLTNDSVSGAGDNRAKVFPRFSEENIAANANLVRQFKALADKKGCTTSQLALAWLRAQAGVVIPIPGTKKIKYLEENLGSLDVQLTSAEEAEIRAFVNGVEVMGGREPPSGEEYGFVDTKEEN